jgi:hypothetical protein
MRKPEIASRVARPCVADIEADIEADIKADIVAIENILSF